MPGAEESIVLIFSSTVIRWIISATRSSRERVGSHHGILEKLELLSRHGLFSIGVYGGGGAGFAFGLRR